MKGARLFFRRNGGIGASCDDVQDTGHSITEESGRFTVYGLETGEPIARKVTLSEAEKAIEEDWRK